MHFEIPTTQDFLHPDGRASFTGFNIHINGTFHACLRYSQLHSLHDQLRRALPNFMLPPFPKKKLFLLNTGQLEERRASLERYIQLIGQDPVFSRSELLRTFLLAAQQESAAEKRLEVTFNVFLMNDHHIPVKCWSTDCSTQVLELVCNALNLPQDYTHYFGLFLVTKEEGGNVDVKRRLLNFESPYVSQKYIDGCHCVLRKCYWDAAYDQELMSDPVGLNLLYIQTTSEYERWTAVVNQQLRDELKRLAADGQKKKEFMEMARNLPNYGSMYFTGCTVDYPERNTNTTVIIGNKELNFQTTGEDGAVEETKFRVTRIRCWKMTTIQNPGDSRRILEMSFEFLMSKNYLKWIQVRSEKAMMMTVCLQSLVHELLNQKSDTLKATSNVIKADAKISFLKRDETNQFVPANANGSYAAVKEKIEDPVQPTTTTNNRTEVVKGRTKEISTTVFFKNGQNRVHNDTFEGIGDDDL